MHPSLTWDTLSDADLAARIREAARAAGNRFCLQLSEEVPPNWKRTIPLILRTLREEAPA